MTMQDIPRFRFDPTINLGHILSAMTIVALGIGGWFALKGDVSSVKTEVAAVRQSTVELTAKVGQITEVLVTTARQEEKINALNGRVERVERAVSRPN